jgi:predicted ATP-grasp superfamily ATP-dependent carboligase
MSKLYKIYGDLESNKGLPMVAMLSGFTDSGATISQISEHLFAHLDNEMLLRFDNDELLDYRSRRPMLFFEKDHIESYEPQTLAIYKIFDEADQPFLFLEGYEPDMRWESFAEAIIELTDLLEVKNFTWVHAIPFPIPHTRPIGVTVSGNRSDMIERFSEWKPQTQVPGNVIHLLEFRLTQYGLAVAGFVLLVPHYLADNEVPKAALSGIEMITAATGLVFPTDELRERAVKFDIKVESQVTENAELQKLVQTLEQGYASGESGPSRAPIGKPSAEPPTADELAEELEQYLATMRKRKSEE